MARAEVPPWRDALGTGATKVTEYLTAERGFQWRERPADADERPGFADGPADEDRRVLEEAPSVLVVQRGRGGVSCTVQAAARSLDEHGGVDVPKTVEQARQTAEQPAALPRRPGGGRGAGLRGRNVRQSSRRPSCFWSRFGKTGWAATFASR